MRKIVGRPILPVLRENMGYYLAGALLILGLKRFAKTAGCDSLRWILAPTAWWAGRLCGFSFEYLPGAGYVNHSVRFLIAPSCAGLRFLTLSFAMLLYSFVHRSDRHPVKIIWCAFSLALSYVTAVFTNGIRIALSVHLPPLLLGHGGWLTRESLHTLTGVLTYFTALSLLFWSADRLFRRFSSDDPNGAPLRSFRVLLLPAFWYLFFLLGVPLLTGSWKKDPAGFIGYALLLLPSCCVLLLPACAGRFLRARTKRKRMLP